MDPTTINRSLCIWNPRLPSKIHLSRYLSYSSKADV